MNRKIIIGIIIILNSLSLSGCSSESPNEELLLEMEKRIDETKNSDVLIGNKWTIQEFYELPEDAAIAQEFIGSVYPNIKILDELGTPHELYDFEGPIILSYSSGGCGACIKSTEAIFKVSQAYPSYNVLSLVKDDDSLHTDNLTSEEMPTPLYHLSPDETYLTPDKFSSYGYPLFIFINEDRVVTLINRGSVTPKALEGFSFIAFD